MCSVNDYPPYEEVTPRCDICNWPENHEGESDWNGETGNHVSCEENIVARLIAQRDLKWKT